MTTITLDDIRDGLKEVGLEDTIRQLAARGEISNLSLSLNASGTRWRAGFTPCSVFGNSFAEDADPCKALHLALTTIKLKTRTRVKDNDLVGTIHQETVEVPAEVPADDAYDPAA